MKLNMSISNAGHTFKHVVTDGETNYLVTVPLCREMSHEIGRALTYYMFFKHGCLSIYPLMKTKHFYQVLCNTFIKDWV